MLSTKVLVRIAAYGGCAVAVTNILMQQTLQNRVRSTTIYKETIEALRSNEKVLKHLGEPVKEGKATVGEYQENLRWLNVRLIGSKTKGNIRCDFVPNDGDVTPSQVFRIEVEFDDRNGHSYILREGSSEETLTTVSV